MNKFEKIGMGCLVVGAMALASTASAAPYAGLDWWGLNDYGVTAITVSPTGNPLAGQLNPVTGGVYGNDYLTWSNTTAGSGAAIWLNQAAADNTSATGPYGTSTANVAFWQTMRTSSLPGHEVSTGLTDSSPWFSWTQRMNYGMGYSQNDMTFNGVGGTPTSSTSGPLAYEPAGFGGDRASIGANFSSAAIVEYKGTAVPNVVSGPDMSLANTAFVAPTTSIVDPLLRRAVGPFPANVANGDIVTWLVGKRLTGEFDVFMKTAQVKEGGVVTGGWTQQYTVTTSMDNPDWFFYQIELRARGGSGMTAGMTQDLLDFSWGNDWTGTWAPPPVPEPASLALLLVGGVTIMARRRKA